MIQALVLWFQENQRPLPWRLHYDPYQVWISEVMLQQTQVETVLPYFNRFIAEFPDAASLAAADEERVFKLWAGLGYYRRARHLMAAARVIAKEHGGKIPPDYETLVNLPGIGQYTAGAILSIAFNKPFPVVDGNVRRVLSRIYGWTEDNPKALWEAAAKLAGLAEPREVNQALMELGATVCSFRSPRCLLCPVQASCIAFNAGMQDKIPPVKKRTETVHVHLFAIVHRDGARALMKAVDGLWEFPTYAELPAGTFTKAGHCRHTITHHRLDVSVYQGRLENLDGYEWKDPLAVPVSSLSRKVYRTAVAEETGSPH